MLKYTSYVRYILLSDTTRVDATSLAVVEQSLQLSRLKNQTLREPSRELEEPIGDVPSSLVSLGLCGSELSFR